MATAVAEHSQFGQDPLRRLRGTLDATLTVTFGDGAQVRSAAAAVARRHGPVRGRLAEDTGTFGCGTSYRADDPDLEMWVFATLVWTAVTVTETLLRPVPAGERDDYYTYARQFGQLFGATQSVMPGDYASLDEYVHLMAREVLFVGPVAHRLARQILAPDVPVLPTPLRPLPALLAAALLPPRTRNAYGLPWRRQEQLCCRPAPNHPAGDHRAAGGAAVLAALPDRCGSRAAAGPDVPGGAAGAGPARG